MAVNTAQIGKSILDKLENRMGVGPENATLEQFYRAAAMTANDLIRQSRAGFSNRVESGGGKRAYYFCMEFLLGRSLKNNLFNLGLTEEFRDVLDAFGVNLDDIFNLEPDAGLGNGGLGRLGACFMDSAASLGYPVTGYSIRYDYGMFRQKIVGGEQTELPDNWLFGGDVWLEERVDEAVNVVLDETVEERWTDGRLDVQYSGGSTVTAVPFDFFVSGYGNQAACVIRLWSARNPSFDMALFNSGNYLAAMEKNAEAEILSKVLYPPDSSIDGKRLRLRQQYFLVSASVQDIIRKHLGTYKTLDNLPDEAVIHLNETHIALVIPELMRIMLDECGYKWDESWAIVSRMVSFTNHTVMSEALEIWPEELFSTILPRIYAIVREINVRLCRRLGEIFPGDSRRIAKMAIIDGGSIRMANLCVAASFSVNGVSAIHSQIVRGELFADYAVIHPERFSNVTNGIDHRRWLCQSNPGLTGLITELIGPGFMRDATKLMGLLPYADDAGVLERIGETKRGNKERFAAYIKKTAGIILDPASLFDVQVKRLHEYKRQTLNILHILHLYLTLKEDPSMEFSPRTFIFGGKAAPGYAMAKRIISLICAVSREIEADPAVRDRLKVVFLEDYRVTLAELLMPAAEISEQISLAGTEASGTGNMKLMINGAITIGTLDGANIEMRDAVGADNILIFGLNAGEVKALRAMGYDPAARLGDDSELRLVIDKLRSGVGGMEFSDIADALVAADPFMVFADFRDYSRIQKDAIRRYGNAGLWNRMALCNIASAGRFAADGALGEYAERIWKISRW